MFDTYTHTPQRLSELAKYIKVPNDWRMLFSGTFLSVKPPQHPLPDHGFKIRFNFLPFHLSDAIKAVQITAEICSLLNTPFKFVPSLDHSVKMCLKNYPPEEAGKLITLYPDSTSVFEKLLSALDDRIRNTDIRPAPAPISDMEITQNLSFRYGTFNYNDELLIGPDGTEYNDVRDVFSLPPWITDLPPWITDKIGPLEAPDTDPETEVLIVSGYKIEACVHRTFAGATYLASDTQTGQRLIFKEARPNVYDFAGNLATERLRNESEILASLAHVPLTPKVLERLEAEGHRILVMEAVLNTEKQLAQTLYHFWQVRTTADNENEIRMRIAKAALTCLMTLHANSIAWIDFSPRNILVTDPDRLTLRIIDAEYAIQNATRDELQHDLKALGRLMLWLKHTDADLLNPNIALRETDFAVLAATPAAYRSATHACFERDTHIHRISSLLFPDGPLY